MRLCVIIPHQPGGLPDHPAWTAFDADTGKDMGRGVREYIVPDFSDWKDRDAYRQVFDRLLRDLTSV